MPTATDAQPMTAIDAFRQDARTQQDTRLPDDWATIALSWEGIHDLQVDTIGRSVINGTGLNGTAGCQVSYATPFRRCTGKSDHCSCWKLLAATDLAKEVA